MKQKVWTVLGTRPEIIRLAPTIKLFDSVFDHKVIHTGQNSGKHLSEVFFEELDLREPDIFLGAKGENLGQLLGVLFTKIGELLSQERPDACVVLGDTNSALTTILFRRYEIPTYHLEAGNRCFDSRVPEEVNRRIIDHTADFNIAYNEISHRNLISEGLPAGRQFISGSPMREVLEHILPKTQKSDVLGELGVEKGKYLLFSFHRQENVDSATRLSKVLELIEKVTDHFEVPSIFSVHPRTQSKLAQISWRPTSKIILSKPFGLIDYTSLQLNSKAVISDSGSLAEESSILGFLGISARETTERQEALIGANFYLTGLSPIQVIRSIESWRPKKDAALPSGYGQLHFSSLVANVVGSTAFQRDFYLGST